MCEPKIFPMRCIASGSRSVQLCSNHTSNHKWIVRTGKNTHIYFIGWILLLSLSRSVCDYSIFDGYGASIAWYRPLFQLRFLSTFFLLIFFSILHIRRKKKKELKTRLSQRQGVTRIHIVKLCKFNWIWSAITLKKRRKRIFPLCTYIVQSVSVRTYYVCVYLHLWIEQSKPFSSTNSFVCNFSLWFFFSFCACIFLVRA